MLNLCRNNNCTHWTHSVPNCDYVCQNWERESRQRNNRKEIREEEGRCKTSSSKMDTIKPKSNSRLLHLPDRVGFLPGSRFRLKARFKCCSLGEGKDNKMWKRQCAGRKVRRCNWEKLLCASLGLSGGQRKLCREEKKLFLVSPPKASFTISSCQLN